MYDNPILNVVRVGEKVESSDQSSQNSKSIQFVEMIFWLIIGPPTPNPVISRQFPDISCQCPVNPPPI